MRKYFIKTLSFIQSPIAFYAENLCQLNFLKCKIWNAIKNLFRGISECLPLTFLVLRGYDTIRDEKYKASIDRQIEQEQDCCGVAIDGKVVITLRIDRVAQAEMKPLFTVEGEDQLNIWASLCSEFLERRQKSPMKRLSNETKNMREIFSFFKEKIENIDQKTANEQV